MTTTMTRRVLAAAAVGAALALPTVTFPSDTATAAPLTDSECTYRYGYVPAEPTIDPSTGRKKFAVKRKPSPEALECMMANVPKTGKSYIHYLVVGGLGVIWLGYYVSQKRRGTWTTLGEDVQELRDGVAADYQAYVERKHAKQEQREQERIEREQQQAEQPVYDYDDYSPEPYTEPAPTTPAPTQTNDDDGWGL